MKHSVSIFAFLITLSMVVLSCQNRSMTIQEEISGQTHIESNVVATTISNQPLLDRESPFVKREFNPYLGDRWIGKAISYGCYREGQAPGVKGASEDEILEDLNILSQYWNLFRVYGADSDSERILNVIKKNNLPFRVMLGVWLENETKLPERQPANLEQVKKAIELANRFPDLIVGINVGNESQVSWSWHHMEAETLIHYIRMVRAGTDIPVATADDYNFWNKTESQVIANEIDFIVLHAYALWNGQQLDHAIQWTDSVYQDIQSKHPEMTIALGETGWATVYNSKKIGPGEQGTLIKGEVSISAQENFLIDLNNWIEKNQVTTFLFEAFDEPWKGGGEQSGPNEVEKNWGVFYKDRTPKASFKGYLKQINRSSN
ncbi:MAG: glycosyl hydrolase family 17 [Candidatus Marinimicrobia bacterium]|nr:glycosyl hydrolase family 17 [Candidatus Neomarinimicrobiota bacterium]